MSEEAAQQQQQSNNMTTTSQSQNKKGKTTTSTKTVVTKTVQQYSHQSSGQQRGQQQQEMLEAAPPPAEEPKKEQVMTQSSSSRYEADFQRRLDRLKQYQQLVPQQTISEPGQGSQYKYEDTYYKQQRVQQEVPLQTYLEYLPAIPAPQQVEIVQPIIQQQIVQQQQQVQYGAMQKISSQVIATNQQAAIRGESRIDYVPFDRYVTEYEQVRRQVQVPVKRQVTDYYAVQLETQYIPQVIQEKIIEYVPKESIRERTEYYAVEKQNIIQHPSQVYEAQQYQQQTLTGVAQQSYIVNQPIQSQQIINQRQVNYVVPQQSVQLVSQTLTHDPSTHIIQQENPYQINFTKQQHLVSQEVIQKQNAHRSTRSATHSSVPPTQFYYNEQERNGNGPQLSVQQPVPVQQSKPQIQQTVSITRQQPQNSQPMRLPSEPSEKPTYQKQQQSTRGHHNEKNFLERLLE